MLLAPTKTSRLVRVRWYGKEEKEEKFGDYLNGQIKDCLFPSYRCWMTRSPKV
jgi:hypothetical protein